MRGLVAVIPARGGSTRVPRKNVLEFFGHPMLAYTVAAARGSRIFDEVLVSTDDAEIADVARAHGAEVVDRPAELALDAVPSSEVVLHAIASVGEVDAVCQLMPNCPLRTSADVQAHWAAFSGHGGFQISVVPFRGVYPHWSLERSEDGSGRWYLGEALVRSQDLAPLVCPTGAIWWADADALRRAQTFYGPGFRLEPIDADRGFDIDTAEDLALADLLVRGLRDRDGRSPLEPVEPVDA